jgi:mono/diheme cytochrome c family protein
LRGKQVGYHQIGKGTRMGIRKILVFGTLMLAAGCASRAGTAAGAGGGAAASVTVTPQMISQGQALFTGQARCGSCHGPMGRGTNRAPNLADASWLWVQTGAAMHNSLFNVIKNGVDAPKQFPTGMPAMGGQSLTDDQIHALAAYVQSLSSS